MTAGTIILIACATAFLGGVAIHRLVGFFIMTFVNWARRG